jgi:hypothetical protein
MHIEVQLVEAASFIPFASCMHIDVQLVDDVSLMLLWED